MEVKKIGIIGWDQIGFERNEPLRTELKYSQGYLNTCFQFINWLDWNDWNMIGNV